MPNVRLPMQPGNWEFLNSYLAQPSPSLGNRLYYIGDSITVDGASGSGLDRNNPGCYASWVGPLSNQRLRYAGRSATVSYQTDQILSTHVPVALTAAPSMCVVQGGGNDVGNSIPIATIQANLKSIYSALLNADILPVATTMTPRTGSITAQKLALWQMNQWVSRYAEQIGIPCVDWFPSLTNTNSGTDWAAGISSDAAHPNSAGAKVMAQAISDTLAGTTYQSYPTGTVGPVGNAYRPPLVSSNADAACAIGNQLYLTDTNVDGIPDNWSVAGAAGTFSLATDASVLGNFWSITRGANDLDATCTAVNVTPGDRLMFACRAQVTIAASGTVIIEVTDNPAKALHLITPMWLWDTSMGTTVTLYGECTVPTGTTQVTVRVRTLTGAATVVKIAQPTLLNLTANGIA